MTSRPAINSLRPESTPDYGTGCDCDYPVPLFTRRQLAQNEEHITHQRESAPRRIRSNGSRRPY